MGADKGVDVARGGDWLDFMINNAVVCCRGDD